MRKILRTAKLSPNSWLNDFFPGDYRSERTSLIMDNIIDAIPSKEVWDVLKETRKHLFDPCTTEARNDYTSARHTFSELNESLDDKMTEIGKLTLEAEIELRKGNSGNVIEHLLKLYQFTEEDSELRHGCCRVLWDQYYILEEWVEAEKYMREAYQFQKDPSNHKFQRSWASFDLGLTLALHGERIGDSAKKQEAIDLIIESIETNPPDKNGFFAGSWDDQRLTILAHVGQKSRRTQEFLKAHNWPLGYKANYFVREPIREREWED